MAIPNVSEYATLFLSPNIGFVYTSNISWFTSRFPPAFFITFDISSDVMFLSNITAISTLIVGYIDIPEKSSGLEK